MKTLHKKTDGCFDTMLLLARLLIVPLFAMSALGKITGFSGSVSYASSSWASFGGVIPGELFIIVAIIMEVFAVVALLTGWKFKEGVFVLGVYTALATIMFHVGPGQMMMFLKNIAILGGLFALKYIGPGKFVLMK